MPLVMEPFGQAAISALAMQQGSFGAGTLNNTGSAGKGSLPARCSLLMAISQLSLSLHGYTLELSSSLMSNQKTPRSCNALTVTSDS